MGHKAAGLATLKSSTFCGLCQVLATLIDIEILIFFRQQI
jgi:hypothetical protein